MALRHPNHKEPFEQRMAPMWYKMLLTILGCFLLGELLIILWASWAILTFQ